MGLVVSFSDGREAFQAGLASSGRQHAIGGIVSAARNSVMGGHGQTCGREGRDFLWIVGHQADLSDAQLLQYLSRKSECARIVLETEHFVGVERVEATDVPSRAPGPPLELRLKSCAA